MSLTVTDLFCGGGPGSRRSRNRLICCWCGKKLTRNASSWSVTRDASRHDETCPADPIRSTHSPTNGGTA